MIIYKKRDNISLYIASRKSIV